MPYFCQLMSSSREEKKSLPPTPKKKLFLLQAKIAKMLPYINGYFFSAMRSLQNAIADHFAEQSLDVSPGSVVAGAHIVGPVGSCTA